jgi:repressor LexA
MSDYTRMLKEYGENTRNRILDYIVGYMMDNQYPPTLREICDGVGLKSTSTVAHHLEKMKDQGLVDINDDREPRTIRVPGIEYREV